MSNAIIPAVKRSRGRPRKNATLANPARLQNYAPPSYALKRKFPTIHSDDIEILDYNGFGGDHLKRPKTDDDLNQSKRLLPPRRARFTESYGGTAGEVVTLSDDENDSESESDDSDCAPMPSPPPQTKTAEELREWEEDVEKLKKSLSDEEMKLVLLRKLKDSQKCKDPKRETCDSPAPTLSIAQKPLALTSKSGIQIQPLPSKQLLKSSQYLSSRKEIRVEKPSQNQSMSLSVPKQSSASLFKPVHPPTKTDNKKESPVVTPKYVPEQINSNHLHQYPLLKNLSNQITITAVPPVPSSSTTSSTSTDAINSNSISIKQEERVDTEALHQRQAAAKLALRKQLEKTLLQIPLPKPPPLKINFFPNPNSIEFLCLIGLDFVVDFLTKSKKNTPLKDPLRCAQCSTDFTCAWKWKEVDRNGKKAYDVFCEACITSNIRKALKAQHTNNLKSAFLKALQQEKEIDRLAQTMPKAHLSTSVTREIPRPVPHLSVPAPAHQTKSSTAFSIPKPNASIPYIPKTPPIMSPAAALAAQVSKLSPQYQSLLQAQAQQLLAAGVPLHPSMLSLSPFVTPPMNHSRSKSSNSMRRQYRADRVQSPSIPQPKSSWKA